MGVKLCHRCPSVHAQIAALQSPSVNVFARTVAPFWKHSHSRLVSTEHSLLHKITSTNKRGNPHHTHNSSKCHRICSNHSNDKAPSRKRSAHWASYSCYGALGAGIGVTRPSVRAVAVVDVSSCSSSSL